MEGGRAESSFTLEMSKVRVRESSPDCSLELNSTEPPNLRVKVCGSSREPAELEWVCILKVGLRSGKTAKWQKFDFGIVPGAFLI